MAVHVEPQPLSAPLPGGSAGARVAVEPLIAGHVDFPRAAMVDGRPDLGLMSSGQVAGVIEDLPSCSELIDRVMAEAEARLAALTRAR